MGSWPPGWHLECSAMTVLPGFALRHSRRRLDLRFPHHENDWPSRPRPGDDFANFWMHNLAWSPTRCEKMSKSIGNTISPAQMLKWIPRPLVVRHPTWVARITVRCWTIARLLCRRQQRLLRRVESFLDATSGLLSKPDRPRCLRLSPRRWMTIWNIPRCPGGSRRRQTRAPVIALAAAGEDASGGR